MEMKRSESPRSFAVQQSDNTAMNNFDQKLASAYTANSELSLEILEEFAAVDREGF
jgi:ABC-type uncharacterized transport system substrate-binding protein